MSATWLRIVLLTTAVLIACDGTHAFELPTPAVDDYSNIYARDYVGPQVCGECHKKQFRQWSNNLHRAMNRRPGAAGVVMGAFDDHSFGYAGGRVTLTGGETRPMMEFHRDGQPAQRFRVTRTIGSRYMQEYVGVQVGGSGVGSGVEVRLPFGYLIRRKRWMHQQYFDSWYGAEYDQDGKPTVDAYQFDRSPWSQRCIWCHNTYPFELSALRGSGPTPLGNGREQFYRVETVRRDKAFIQTLREKNHLPPQVLLSVGIGCETCHLGGREHADNDRDISFLPRSPDLKRNSGGPDLSAGRESHVVINSICSQCHSTPSSRFPNRGVRRNASEALDLFAGNCTSKIKCTNCHDPHIKGPGADAPDQARHLGACVKCHPALATAEASQTHSRHPADTVSCLDCHMPKMVQGVASFVRSHRISSPTNRAMLSAGAPNACNMCHLDRSIAWTLQQLRSGWGKVIKPTGRWLAKYGGTLDQPLGEVWLKSKRRSYRAMAASAYARSRLSRTALRLMLERLDDPVAYYRMWMLYAVERTLERKLSRAEYDPAASPATRARQVRALLQREQRAAL